ncbi:response regulator [Flavobacterium aquidurense]|uniref:response regulator n=1 Tax=Flavobacterium aquidurense TaxID=362413 RepID=UPI003720A95A
MKKFLITNQPNTYKDLEQKCTIIDVSTFVENVPAEWANYANEFIPFLICERINDNQIVVGIDFSINEDLRYLLAHHILTSYLDCLLFFITDDLTHLTLHLENDLGLFKNKAIKIIDNEHLNELFKNDEEIIRLSAKFSADFSYSIYTKNYQRQIDLDTHQASNEWGAIKLMLNHGISLSTILGNYKIPLTIFLKQKLKEHKITSSSVVDYSSYSREPDIIKEKSKFAINIPVIQKILLVDDNANKGWEFAIQKIFPTASIDTKVSFDEANAISDFSNFDFIFLDLRLPTNLVNRTPNIKNGFHLIEKIKNNEKSLHIPLLIFTASQKASTLNQILEYGADAMYVKESTDFTQENSFDNYLNFISEINFLIEKGEHLKKYWKVILLIKSALLPEIVDTSTLILKSRIIERLEMFYGLIKTGYEQSKFNKNKFNYSSDVLSFITLWSILNEIQECFFEKNVDKSYTRIKIGASFASIDLDNWKIKGQSPPEYFIKEKPIFEENVDSLGNIVRPNNSNVRREQYSRFQYKKSTPFFEFDAAGFKSRRINYKERLSLQIAFLLMAKTNLKSSPLLNSYLKILNDSNKQRNKLYLTHGESSSPNFHASLEKNKNLPASTTLNLFKLVAFLLTGNDRII